MARKPKAVRGKFTDEKYIGTEPDLRGNPSNSDIIRAYNYYNYFYDAEQAKVWVIEYLKEFHKSEKELIKNVTRTNSNHISTTCGWNCRILLLGGALPEEIIGRNLSHIRTYADRQGRGDSEGTQPESRNRLDEHSVKGKRNTGGNSGSAKEDKPKEEKRVISIQERVVNRANELIGEIEVLLDAYYRDGTTFKASDWLSQKDVKPAIAQRIADYYKPLYSEVYDAFLGKDVQLREGYSHWKKTKLKAYMEFIKSIVSAAETRATVMKAVRKPRKKKEKPVSVLVSKLKYKEKEDALNIVSFDPKQIVGSNQIWVYNTKYRTLGVYYAMGPAGLNVKGSTLTGFDEKTSIIKKLRKPKEQLAKLKDGGKIVLRKFMDEIKCKPKVATGRINKDTVLVRIIK